MCDGVKIDSSVCVFTVRNDGTNRLHTQYLLVEHIVLGLFMKLVDNSRNTEYHQMCLLT